MQIISPYLTIRREIDYHVGNYVPKLLEQYVGSFTFHKIYYQEL